ncbi:T9SS type A sorting domain-containing protein [Paludibacter sp.]|uniref:T9SS type A sorting domain-containing protein n=1 Tax=Paludibacter sp. TaxID=1898105 RepID=UPI0025CC2ADD|nr:T9SS type A sorting domain-containing protein [Paludibacter sp.]
MTIKLMDRKLESNESLHIQDDNALYTKTITPDDINSTQTYTCSIPSGTYNLTYYSQFKTIGSPGYYNSATQSLGLTTIPNAPSAVTFKAISTDVKCYGEKGSISLSAKDGTAPYTYTIDGSNQGTLTDQSVIATISGLAPGNHTVVVTDSHNCPSYSQVTSIADVNSVTTSIIQSSNITCNGTNDGSVTIKAGGGTPPYSYTVEGHMGSLSDQNSTATISALSPGSHSIVIVDSHNCSSSNPSVTIQDVAKVEASIIAKSDMTCNGLGNGTISIKSSGGNGSYQYKLWKQEESEPSDWIAFTNGATSQITGLSGATYYIKVKDTNGCEAKNTNGVVDTKSVIIINPSPISITTSVTNVDCYGKASGSVTANASGGTGTLHYSWKDRAEQSQTISGLSSGYYTAIVTDDNGCSNYQQAFVSQPSSLPSVSLNYPHNPETFNGNEGYIILNNATGGTPEYTYTWKKDGSSYAVTTSPSLSNLKYGTYTVTISDDKGCSGNTVTVPLSNPVPPIELGVSQKDVTCYQGKDGAITITPSRVSSFTAPVSYTYQWTKDGILLPALSGNQATGLTKGTYSIKVTDNYGATKSIDALLTEMYTEIIPTLAATDVTCNGKSDGTASVSSISGGAGGYTYQWSNGVTTSAITNLTAKQYVVNVYDSKGCMAIGAVLVGQPNDVLTVSLTPTDPTGYNTANGSITANVLGGNGGYTYQWTGTSSASGTASNLAAGDYSVVVKDKLGCVTSASTQLAQPDPLTVSLAIDKAISCNSNTDGALKATAKGGISKTGGYKYTWKKVIGTNEATLYSETATTSSLPGRGAGTYKVLVEDDYNNELLSANTITLPEPPALAIVSQEVKDVKCYGESTGAVSFTVSGGDGSYAYLKNGTEPFSNNQSGLSAGQYSVTIHDGKNCALDHTFTISQPSAPLLVQLQDSHGLSACGSKDGELTATVSGGTAPYTYTWTGSNSTTGAASNLSAGSYSLSVTDNNQCTSGASFRLIDPLKVNLVVKDPIRCYGEMGRIAARAAGGEPASIGLPYTYRWYRIINENTVQLTQSDSIAVNLTAGSYQVEIEDTKGRILRSQIFQLIQPDQLTVASNVKQVSCKGDANGAISLAVSGGNGDYTYLWETGQTTSNRNNLQPGTYSVSISDRKGCLPTPEVLSIGISEPTKLVVSLSKTDVTVAGCDGSATATAGGGTTPYLFSWNGSENEPSNRTDKLCSGKYKVTVTDKNMCVVKDSIFLPPPLVANIIVKDTIACHGDKNGSIQAQVKGGVPYKSRQAYDYIWKKLNTAGDYEVLPAETGSSMSGLASGWYALNITDSIGAVFKTDSLFFLTEPAILTESTIHSDISCYGMNNGKASINVKGGTLPYNYQWSNNVTTAVVNNLPPGKYHIEVIDRHHCALRDSATIEEPKLLTVSLQQKEIIEHDACTGTITAITDGGMKPYRFEWEGTSTTSNMAAGLCAGSYSIKATDANGCTCSANAVLLNPPALRATVSIKDSILCFGDVTGALKAKVEGGIPYKARRPYDYVWKKKSNAGIYEPLDNQSESTITGLSSGWYALQVSDSMGVSLKSDSLFYFSQPNQLVIRVKKDDVLCHGASTGSIKAIISGGSFPYRLQWNTGDTTDSLKNIKAGDYTISVSDRNQCASRYTATINQSDSLIVGFVKTVLPSSPTACDGSLQANVMGGVRPYLYRWNRNTSGDSIASDLCSNTTYTLSVTDLYQCPVEITKKITDTEQPLVASLFVKDSVLCHGVNRGVIAARVSGGIPFISGKPYTYIWSRKNNEGIYRQMANSNDSLISGLSGGWYSFSVKDADNNQLAVPVSIFLPEPDTLLLVSQHTDITCFGLNNGSASVQVRGGIQPYNYHWNTDSNTSSVDKLLPGKYTIDITDYHHCIVHDSVTIKEPARLALTLHQQNITEHDVCDGAITASITGGIKPYVLNWTGTHPEGYNATGLCAGMYSVEVADANGCSDRAGTLLVNPPALQAVVSVRDSVLCNGDKNGALKVSVSGGIPYRRGKPYRYVWKKRDGFGLYQVISDFADNLATGLSSGWHAVNISDSVGVSLHADSLFYLPEPNKLILQVTHNDITCYGNNNGTASVIATGGVLPYTYSWSNGSRASSIENLTQGAYAISVTDRHSCNFRQAVTIVEPALLAVELKQKTISEHDVCDGVLQANVTGGRLPYTYSWTGVSAPTASVNDLCAGSYGVKVTDASGCVATNSSVLKNPPALKLQLTIQDSVQCHGNANGTLKASAKGGIPYTTGRPYRYAWRKKNVSGLFETMAGYDDSIAAGLGTGVYACNITDANGISLHQDSIILLPEPDFLQFAIRKTNIGCSGTDEGNATAIVSGGTVPYAYAWNTGDKTATIDHLAAGAYIARVTDLHGCVAAQQTIISKASPLYMSLYKINPVCYLDCNGSIIATVSGGTTPYLYRWTGTTVTGANASALCAGDYSLSVTDAAGCLVQKGEFLTNPAQLPLNLGSDRFICNGQMIRYNIEIAGLSGITYNWIGPEGFVSSKAVVDITRAGIYKASVSDTKGCRNTATVILKPSETTVDNEFVLPTQAFVNEKIVVVNTTHPVPDSIQWVLPAGAQVSTMGQAYVEFMVPDTGAYVIRMVSYKGECNAQQDKRLLVSDRSQLNSIGTTKTPFIRSFNILPNPNHGNFEVKIDLQDKADVQLKLINILSNRVVSQIKKSGDSSYEVPINVSLPPGTYLMLLETPKGSTTAKVIIF